MEFNILLITYPLSALVITLMVVGLGVYLTRKFNLGWRLYLIGAAGFIISQVGHIPFNAAVGALFQRGILPPPPAEWQLVFNAVFLGLSAGFFEEFTRYGVYRWWAKDARSWPEGVLLGAGHGGVEALIVAGIIIVAYLTMVSLYGQDLSTLASGAELEALQRQYTVYWSSTWFASMLGALERALTIPVHIALSVLVLQVFVRGQVSWLWLAIFWHAAVNAVAVYVSNTWGAYAAEGAIALFTLASVGMIFALRGPEREDSPHADIESGQTTAEKPEMPAIEVTADSLDRSRYTD